VALQTQSRWTGTDTEYDFDIVQHLRAGRHTKQLEKAIDDVLAKKTLHLPYYNIIRKHTIFEYINFFRRDAYSTSCIMFCG